MEKINDREMMRQLGIGDLTLQRILSKSRQAIHSGLSDKQKYFRLSELQILYVYLKKNMKNKVQIFENFIARTRPKDEVKFITSVYGFFDNPEVLDAGRSALIVVPDFLYLKYENR